MALQNYEGSITVLYNGSALAEATSWKADHGANLREVLTMRKDLAGWAKGVKRTEITIEEATPIAGLEAEFFAHFLAGTVVSLEALIGGKTFRYDGKIESINASASAEGDAMMHSLSIKAGAPQIT
jgi:hypothetical protein